MWYMNNTTDRVMSWRKWRLSLDSLEFNDALLKISADWSMVPRTSHHLTHDGFDEWPTPWSLIIDNYYCDIAVGLGMIYSLLMSKHRNHDIKFMIYDDKIAQARYNLVVIDNNFVLNWELREVSSMVEIPKSAKLIYQIDASDLNEKIGNM